MAAKDQNNIDRQTPEFNDVIVVGAGPVGLVASLLLSKYHVHHLLVEQLAEPDNHPQAHFINCRSMEVLRELDGLDEIVRAKSPPLDDWRRFVYCTGLADLPALDQAGSHTAGSLLGVVDHFDGVVDLGHSPAQVTHFAQHDFVKLLRKSVRQSRFCSFLEDRRADIREYPKYVAVKLTDNQTGRQLEVQAKFIVAADGAHSQTRKQLGIELISESGTIQNLMNVHFFSTQLSERLRSRIPAMLYFIYSPHGVAVLVAHTLAHGEFVAQIPFFPPYQQPADFDKNGCIDLLHKLVGAPDSLDVKSIRSWRMGIWEASRFRSKGGRCFLIGDAAHQLTPAGGFGMNTGIQDAHNLIWKIVTALRFQHTDRSESAEQLLPSYEDERRPIARLNAKISIENFNQTLLIPRAIGLALNNANLLSRAIERLPAPSILKRVLFQSAMRLGLKQVGWLNSNHFIARRRRRAVRRIFKDAKQQTLQLLFPGQDLGFVYASGWPEASDKFASDAFDPFEFKPVLKLGGRMPHFWLDGMNGRPVSVLDLPMQAANPGRPPCYVLLVTGDTETGFEKFNEIRNIKFGAFDIVSFELGSDLQDNAHFSFQRKRPSFLPSSFTVLIRPDGHIAWLHIP
jgi:2-polyprenyl-6-methoxyphenol hydroxylase-like FAD-dependent oxidoreductase